MRVLRLAFPSLLLLALLAPPAAAQATPVEVGILVINVGNYDANRGTYVMDFYLWFRYNASASGDVNPERFEFMNGRATSKEKLTDETDATTGVREIWYRVQAALYSEPHFARYPYDTQQLEILLEDSLNSASALKYRPLEAESGLDDAVRVSGWRIQGVELSTTEKTYKFEETYDRVRFVLTIYREPLSTSLKSFLPPAAFVIVAGLSFFFHPSKVAQRLALGTGMLISAVGFHISQIVSLPPLAQLILFDKVMISVYTFIASGLVVTTLIAIDEDYWKDRDYTKPINLWGAVVAIALPALTFLFLEFL